MATTSLSLPGTTGNYASVPDSAALSITGDIDIRVRVSLVDWTPTSPNTLISKWVATSNQRSFNVYVNSAGRIGFQTSSLGTAAATVDSFSSAGHGIPDGELRWVRVTWRQSDGRTQFFTSINGTAWTQIGTDVTNAGASMFDSTAPLEVGAQAGGTIQYTSGQIYQAQIRNNILDNGTGIVFNVNFEAVTITGTRTPNTVTESANGATVTINGSAWDWASRNIFEVQRASASGPSTPIAATYGATPAAGNLLVAVVRANGSGGVFTLTGWTPVLTMTISGAGLGYISMFCKVAGAGESTSVSVAVTGGPSQLELHIFEYTGLTGWTVDVSASDAGTGAAVFTQTTGTTGATANAEEIAIAAVGSGNSAGGLTWSNGFVLEISGTRLYTASKVTSATGTQGSTATWGGTSRTAGGAIAVFKGASSAPPRTDQFLALF